MRKHLKFIFAGVLLLSSQGGSAPLWAAQMPDAERSIRSLLAQWVLDVNAGRIVASNQIWADDVIGWYPGRPDFTRDTVRAAIAKGDRPPRPNSRIEVQIDEVLVDGKLAVVRDQWRTYERSGPQESWKVRPDYIRGFEIWQRGNRGWKITRWISAPERIRQAG